MQPFSLIRDIKQSIKQNKSIIIFYSLLALFSGILVNSAMVSMLYDHSKPFDAFTYIDMIKHLFFLFVGLIFVIVIPVLIVDYKKLRIWFFIYISIFFLLLIYLCWGGPVINGAKRWFVICGISIQPSEFFKLGIIAISAFWGETIYKKRRKMDKDCSLETRLRYEKSINSSFWGFWICSIISISFILVSSLSSAIIYSIFVFVFTLMLRPNKIIFIRLILYVIVGIAGLFLLLKLSDKLPERISTWSSRLETTAGNKKDPFSINDKNRQQQFAKIALANGKWFGVGFNNSKMKSSLSMAYSDYIMSIAYEEWGIFSLLVIITMFVFWMIFARNIARDSNHIFLTYVAYGIGMFYPIQVIVNFFVASGYMSTGQPLPIIGYGGSSILGAALSLSTLSIINNITLKEKQSNNDTESDN